MTNTDVRLCWSFAPQIVLTVQLAARALTAQEIHQLAEVVETIEQFRSSVQGIELGVET